MALSEGNISRENLEKHGIFIDDNKYLSNDPNSTSESRVSLPDHVDALREALLSIPCIGHHYWKGTFDEEYEKFGNTEIGEIDCLRPQESMFLPPLKSHLRPTQESTKADKHIEECEKVAEAARRQFDEMESGWTRFFHNKIFRDFYEEEQSNNAIDLLFNEWSLQENYRWSDVTSWEIASSKAERRTQPQPDLTYGFPVISSTEKLPKGFVRDDFVQCFSLEVLGTLRTNNICSTTTTGLKRWTQRKDEELTAKDKLCFPWAIVELKKSIKVPASEVEKCYCQAANASAAALSLRAQLFTMAYGNAPVNLPPIIAFTSIGPRIKVWLTYRVKQRGVFITKMSPIWSTSIELTWGVVVMRHVVKSMHFWSPRILKSKMAAAVCQIQIKLNSAVATPIRTPLKRGHLSVSSPPGSYSGRRRSRSRTGSPSVQSHESVLENTDEDTLVDNVSLPSDNFHYSSEEEDDEEEEEGSEEEYDSDGDEEEEEEEEDEEGEDVEQEWESEEEEDEVSSGSESDYLDTAASDSDDLASIYQELSSDDEYIYSSPETSDAESSSDSSGNEIESSRETRYFVYTRAELRDRREVAIEVLSGSEFARLSHIHQWFENLTVNYQIKTIWSLIDASNGGLRVRRRQCAGRDRLEELLTMLNNALKSGVTEVSPARLLTANKLGPEKFGPRVRNGVRAMLHDRHRLQLCLEHCLCLFNDNFGDNCLRKSVFDVIGNDLVMFYNDDWSALEKAAFDLLIDSDQNSGLLP